MSYEKKSDLKTRLQEALDARGKRAIDLANALEIANSAISYYLSGRSTSMSAERLEKVCEYLNVSEPWLLGYDVPMERQTPEKNDIIADAVFNMKKDPDFFLIVSILNRLRKDQIVWVRNMLAVFPQQFED